MGNNGRMSLEAQATDALSKLGADKLRSFNNKRGYRTIMKSEFKKLGKMFKGLKIENVKDKHIHKLVHRWKSEKVSIGAMKNRMAVIRNVTALKGVELPKSNSHFKIEERKVDYNTDKSWSPSENLLSSLDKEHRLHVELMHRFGMRFEEAAKFRPEENIIGEKEHLHLKYGCKNGRERDVPIRTDYQRELLQRVSDHCKDKDHHNIISKDSNYVTWKRHAEYVYKGCGMTKDGIGTCHGLRHDYFQDRYENLTGWKSPCNMGGQERLEFRASMSKEMKELDRQSRLIVSNEAGHGRVSVSATYIGSWRG